jgi:hypothetical protein
MQAGDASDRSAVVDRVGFEEFPPESAGSRSFGVDPRSSFSHDGMRPSRAGGGMADP